MIVKLKTFSKENQQRVCARCWFFLYWGRFLLKYLISCGVHFVFCQSANHKEQISFEYSPDFIFES